LDLSLRVSGSGYVKILVAEPGKATHKAILKKRGNWGWCDL